MALSLRRKTKDVDIEQEDGTVLTYKLMELKGSGRDDYMAEVGRRMVFKAGQPVGARDPKGLMTKLIGLSLFDPNGTLVPEKVINDWPSSTQIELFRMAQILSGLTVGAEEEAKND